MATMPNLYPSSVYEGAVGVYVTSHLLGVAFQRPAASAMPLVISNHIVSMALLPKLRILSLKMFINLFVVAEL